MIKLAKPGISPSPGTLLSGLGSWALPGAAIGAAGMGAANLMSPEDPITHKKKSLLKSMLLGGALGGSAFAGARAYSDWKNPAIASDPGMATDTLFGTPPTPAEANPITAALGWSPATTTAVGGGAGFLGGAGYGHRTANQVKTFDTDYKIPGNLVGEEKLLAEAQNAAKRRTKVNIRDGWPSLYGAAAGSLLGGLSGFAANDRLQDYAKFNANNTLPGLRDIVAKTSVQ